MTTFVYMDNYRGFADTAIPLKRVNWLVGENSTGKTSFLELLETLSYPPFWLFEPRFGVTGSHQKHFFDLISASSGKKNSFTIGALGIDSKKTDSSYGMFVTYVNDEGRPQPSRVSIVENGQIKTVDGALWNSKAGARYKARIKNIDTPTSDDAEGAKKYAALHAEEKGFTKKTVAEDVQGNPIFIRCAEVLFDGKGIRNRGIKVPSPFDSDLVSLAPIRTKPRRTYDAPQTEFSPEGEHTPYVIRKNLSANKSQANEFRQFLEKAGAESGLFRSVEVKSYGKDPLAPFEMQIVLGNSALGMDNVGYGVSQSLPVIVEMFVRPRKTAFTIQQPEVHLHPRAQATFGDLVAQLSRDEQKKFIIETHSDFSIDRFRLNVRRNGAIPSQLLFFQRNETGNFADPIDINESGDLPDSQPSAYREFFFNESLSLLG